ncbi:MAG: retropepsin-like aspartic protease [Thermoanaerobaculia bacterium]
MRREGGLGQLVGNWAVLAIWIVCGLAKSVPAAGAKPDNPPSRIDLQALYESRDFFALREQLAGDSDGDLLPPEHRFFAAAVELAFNQPAASIRIAESALAKDDLPPLVSLRLQHLLVTANLRLHSDDQALSAARALLASPIREEDSAVEQEIRGTLPLLEALADVPPQQARMAQSSRLALGATRRVPLRIGDAKREFSLDTGANFSVIMASEAEALGLTIRPAGVEVATSTDVRVMADVAVAERMSIGKVDYSNVVFLVFPDELLTFPGGHRIPGLIGFPVVEAMGEIRFRRDDVMEIPSRPPVRKLGNLALDDLDPLVQIRYGGDDLVCRLDTGADKTVFYEPFFQRYRERLESMGRQITVTTGGVGGLQELPALQLPRVALTLAAAGTNLQDVDVYTRPIRAPEENFLYCNVGLDVLQEFSAYVINFRDMALVLE